MAPKMPKNAVFAAILAQNRPYKHSICKYGRKYVCFFLQEQDIRFWDYKEEFDV